VRRLAAFVRSLAEGVRARPLLDVEPVLERAWAARAGLGFVGKNGLVITPGLGSYQLLGEVVTTLELAVDEPIAERCGSCTRCLDACPTSAFVAPWVLDARRCISYLTIEREAPVPSEHREAVAGHLFGCDVCQEVCPYNATSRPSEARTGSFEPLAGWATLSLEALVDAEPALFEGPLEGSPARRAGARGLRDRAVLVALRVLLGEGSGSPGPSGAELADARRALARASLHPDPAVRDVARYASAQLAGQAASREGVGPSQRS
jgi:epoxyqueuosine reductase